MSLTEIVKPLLSWYRTNARDLPWRQEVSPYHVWVSEIMLQQTRVEAVKGYFSRFTEVLPDLASLAACSEQQLLKLWEGLGYYNRVRNLQKAAQVVMERHAGSLPASYEALLELPGIGPYTAGAIASIAFGIPVPAVDGNVLRVMARLTADASDIAEQRVKRLAEDKVREMIPQDNAGMFTQALMELGAVVCLPNGAPLCEQCPLSVFCEGRKQGIAQELPVKSAKKPRRIEDRTVLLLVHDRRVAIRRRDGKGLLAGLWEFPTVLGELTGTQAIPTVRELGLEPLRIQAIGRSKHIFTHIEWQMSGLLATVEQMGSDDALVWADVQQLREEYPLPSAFRAYLGYFFEKTPFI